MNPELSASPDSEQTAWRTRREGGEGRGAIHTRNCARISTPGPGCCAHGRPGAVSRGRLPSPLPQGHAAGPQGPPSASDVDLPLPTPVRSPVSPTRGQLLASAPSHTSTQIVNSLDRAEARSPPNQCLTSHFFEVLGAPSPRALWGERHLSPRGHRRVGRRSRHSRIRGPPEDRQRAGVGGNSTSAATLWDITSSPCVCTQRPDAPHADSRGPGCTSDGARRDTATFLTVIMRSTIASDSETHGKRPCAAIAKLPLRGSRRTPMSGLLREACSQPRIA